MRKIFFCFFLLLSLSIYSKSEYANNLISINNNEIHTLQQIKDTINKSNPKIKQINNFYKSGLDLIENKEFEKGFEAIDLGLKESKIIKNNDLVAFGYFYLSTYYQKKKNYHEALVNVNSSLKIFTALNNEDEIYKCYFRLGRLYYNTSEFENSISSYFKSLKIAEKWNNEKEIAVNLEKIGEVYLITPDLKKARINFNEAIKIFTKINYEYGIIANLTNLGASYQKEGINDQKKELVIKAIEIYKKGLVRAKNTKNERSESIFLGNIGSSFRTLKKYDESLDYLFKALELKLELKRFESAAHSCNDISETYIEMNKLLKAKEFAVKAVKYSKGLNIHKERFAYYLLSKIEYGLNNYKNSYNFLKRFHKLQDSLLSIEKIKSINEMQIKYETEKKSLTIEVQESDIALLDSRNKIKNQWLLFGGLGLLSVFGFVVLYRSRKTITKEKQLQEKFSQDLLLSQEEERIRIARELHDSVGQQLTLIKKKAQNLKQEELTSLTDNTLDEVRNISRGLYPTLLKQLGLTESIVQLINDYDEETDLFFSMDVDFVDSYFSNNTSLNFYRLIQECLTNIVKHAKAKTVTISIKKKANSIVTLISDNGKGFNLDDSKKKNSLGLKTIFERIKIMNGELSIDSKINNGTNFLFTIPIKNE